MLSLKVLAVCGESQHGKSSFINKISGTNHEAVGSGDGKSCTFEPHKNKFPDHLHLFGNTPTEISCNDIPGFGDTDARVTNQKILVDMKDTLVKLGTKELNAILVFQSLAESTFQLGKTLSRIASMYGPDFVRSAIVILTKSDVLAPKEVTKRLSTILEIISPKGIPHVMWVNDSLDGPVEAAQAEEQEAALRTALARMQPYQMMGIEEYTRLVEERAKRMMAQDIVLQSVPVKTQKIETYTETQVEKTRRTVQALSEEQVKALARLEAFQKSTRVVKVTEGVDVVVPEVVMTTKTVQTTSNFLFWEIHGTAEVEVPEIKYKVHKEYKTTPTEVIVEQDPSLFEAKYRIPTKEESVFTTVEVEKHRPKDVIEMQQVPTTRHDEKYYKEKARKELAKETLLQGAPR